MKIKLKPIVEMLRNLETDELNEVLSKLNETHEQNIDYDADRKITEYFILI